MEATEEAFEFIKDREKCRLKAYRDPIGRWTIGYGATGMGIGPDTVWTQEQADTDLTARLLTIGRLITKSVVTHLTQNQFNALVSFVYNVGITNFRGSNVLRLINQQKFKEAAQHMLLWNKAGGEVLDGLTLRRQAEVSMFLAQN